MRKVEISHRTIVFTVVFLILIWFLFFIRDIIVELFVALLIMAVLSPLVNLLSKWKVPRAIAIILSYFVIFGLFGVAIYSLVPPLIIQTASFAVSLPGYLEKIPTGLPINDQLFGQVLSQLGDVPTQILKVIFSLFSNIVGILTVLIFSFYLLLSRSSLDQQLESWFGEIKSKQIVTIINVLEKRLGSWARGQFVLMLLVGTSTYIGLTILGIPYALPLAILAGLFEIVPYLGPIVSGIPSVLIGLGISPLTGLLVGLMAIFIQQVENYVFVPKVMQKSAGVSPIITLLALAIGSRLAGVIGAVMAIPAFIIIQTLTKNYFASKDEN